MLISSRVFPLNQGLRCHVVVVSDIALDKLLPADIEIESWW